MSRLRKEPFALVPERLLLAPVSDRAIRLWCLLDRHADKEGRAYPGRRRLAEQLGASEASLKRALAELVDHGMVRVKARYRPDGGRTSNDFWLWPSLPDDPTPAHLRADPPITHEPGEGSPVSRQEREPLEREPENELLPREPLPAKPLPDPRQPRANEATAREIAKAVYDARDPKPATPFPGVCQIIEKLLDAGHAAARVKDAAMNVPTISVGWMEGALNSRQAARAPEPEWDRGEEPRALSRGELFGE